MKNVLMIAAVLFTLVAAVGIGAVFTFRESVPGESTSSSNIAYIPDQETVEPQTPSDLIISVEDLPLPDPLSNPVYSNDACNQNVYRLAIIVVSTPSDLYTPARQAEVEKARDLAPNHFAYATEYGARLEVDEEIYRLQIDESVKATAVWDLVNQFYESHQDVYDFIAVYRTYDDDSRIGFSNTNNNISGIGFPVMRYTGFTAPIRHLRGVANMGFIDRFYPNEDGSYDIGFGHHAVVLNHEIGHAFCCYDLGSFAGDELGLSAPNSRSHYYHGLDFGDQVAGLMGGYAWTSNGDGTYAAKDLDLNPVPRKFDLFTRYFMGLVLDSEYDREFNIYDAGYNDAKTGLQFNLTSAPLVRTVSINDIIALRGVRECIQDEPAEIETK